jgi:hypothetical protein
MSTTTIRNLDKIKMLDQMLEDLAGEEYEDYSEAETNANADVKHYAAAEELDNIDTMH